VQAIGIRAVLVRFDHRNDSLFEVSRRERKNFIDHQSPSINS
jgi:hypothetical protein